MRATDVVTSVRRHFGAEKDGYGPEWAGLEEFALDDRDGAGRADLFLIRAWRSRPKCHERVLVEVKVSRADLRHELASPEKMARFAVHAHRVFFAAPAGLVKPEDDLGPGVGLIEVRANGTCTTVRRAARNDAAIDLPERAVVEAFRRAARSEARHREAAANDPAAQVVALTKEIARATQALQTAQAASRRDQRRLNDWLRRVAEAGGVPCTCGGGDIRPERDQYRMSSGRTHIDGTSCSNPYGSGPDIDALGVRLGLTTADDEQAEVPVPHM